MPTEKEPFQWGKQGAAFADLTRWVKDIFGSLRGFAGIAFIVCAVFGCCYLGTRIINRILPKKEISLVSQVSNTGGGRVEVCKIDRQKNSLLGLF